MKKKIRKNVTRTSSTVSAPVIDTSPGGAGEDRVGYEKFLVGFSERFSAATNSGKSPVFTTDVGQDAIFNAYIASIPRALRAHYTCNACRRFIQNFGGLVTIGNGTAHPVMWSAFKSLGPHANRFERVLHDLVYAARITGVFYTSQPFLGEPTTGTWNHLAVKVPTLMLHKSPTQSASQRSAEKLEDYKNMHTALLSFRREHLEQAVNLLSSDALYRNEKVLGHAQWLLNLHGKYSTAHIGTMRANALWEAVALAPAGFCHPRSSMISTLLDDIAAGMPVDQVAQRFAQKMDPMKYQRPVAAPAAGNIAQAEKIVEQLGAAGSLRRRFARLEDVAHHALWSNRLSQVGGKVAAPSVFSHLKETRPGGLVAPTVTITWEKFQRTVLPSALGIMFVAQRGRYPFCALVTAVDQNAPPILQWDTVERRNPVSWYFHATGSTPEEFNLSSGLVFTPGSVHHRVNTVLLKPSMWTSEVKNQGRGVMFIIDGCRDLNNQDSCLFPEILRSEFHGIRATIAAHSKKTPLEGSRGASACGLMLNEGSTFGNLLFMVESKTGSAMFKIDRWD